ncbi:uncharacterized protein LTR77_011071 [Saxophila tyrrhenica]|uniref:Glycine zipper 2TM domain-containing protein n=1 Tax=Saxophila tyrrhenica TaxID=1690608 RepID=A0AAV9NUG9_9PEZI|nr:hypothetical protein LTR77_011071 [Saxophila tyrrhenica]
MRHWDPEQIWRKFNDPPDPYYGIPESGRYRYTASSQSYSNHSAGQDIQEASRRGERGLGAELLGGGAGGAFLGHKMSKKHGVLGAIWGAALGAIGAEMFEHHERREREERREDRAWDDGYEDGDRRSGGDYNDDEREDGDYEERRGYRRDDRDYYDDDGSSSPPSDDYEEEYQDDYHRDDWWGWNTRVEQCGILNSSHVPDKSVTSTPHLSPTSLCRFKGMAHRSSDVSQLDSRAAMNKFQLQHNVLEGPIGRLF